MRIGELAAACDCPAETIRYYEKIGLLPAPDRLANGYRSYDEQHRKWLQFIVRSRRLGFSQDDVRRLAGLARQERPACAEVCSLLDRHSARLRARIAELQSLDESLTKLMRQCHEGASSCDCPVIDELML